MAWNNGLERKKFDEEQERLAAEYRAAGMTEYQIEQMYQFDLKAFNSKRRFRDHNQQFPEPPSSIDEEAAMSPLYEKYIDHLSVELQSSDFTDRYWWLEEIEDLQLAKAARRLPTVDLELITLYAFEQYTVREVAEKIGISKSAVSQRLKRLRKIFRKNS